MKRKVVALAGPTASGKTELSVKLAMRIGGEIISCDSMQCYEGFDIGTAKVTKEEMQNVPHYMIDEFSPQLNVNVALFASRALTYQENIFQNGNIPILTGGSGLYLDSLVYESYDYGQGEMDERYRAELEALAREKGNEAVYDLLERIDPAYAKITHPNNVKRVIRALEYYKTSGKRKSEVPQKKLREENTCYFALSMDRSRLYARIDARVDRMMELGLKQEVQRLLDAGISRGQNAMLGIGYKEMASALCGECSVNKAVEKIKQNSRNFAKRQMTWFRRNPGVLWINLDEYQDTEKILDFMEARINGAE